VISSDPLPETKTARKTRKYVSSTVKQAYDTAGKCSNYGTEVEDGDDQHRTGEEDAVAVDALEGEIDPVYMNE
jgi:hypothetical protein